MALFQGRRMVEVKVIRKGNILAIVNNLSQTSIQETLRGSKKIINNAIDFLELRLMATPGWKYLTSEKGIGELGFANPDTPLRLLEVLRKDSLRESRKTKSSIRFKWGLIDEMMSNNKLSHTLDKVAHGRIVQKGPLVNWFDWVENGISIVGFKTILNPLTFEYSRSFSNIMVRGGSFAIQPMRLVAATSRANAKRLALRFQKDVTTILKNRLAKNSRR